MTSQLSSKCIKPLSSQYVSLDLLSLDNKLNCISWNHKCNSFALSNTKWRRLYWTGLQCPSTISTLAQSFPSLTPLNCKWILCFSGTTYLVTLISQLSRNKTRKNATGTKLKAVAKTRNDRKSGYVTLDIVDSIKERCLQWIGRDCWRMRFKDNINPTIVMY